MGTIVDVTVPSGQFALRDTFASVDDVEFESVRIAAHEAGHVLPFLWASGPDSEAIRDALERDDSTETVDRLASGEERDLYRIEWRPRIRIVVSLLVEEHGTLLSAAGRDGRWELQVLFPDHDAVSDTYDFCKEYGIDISIRRVNGVSDSLGAGGIALSEEQREALTAAFQTDYYAVPRGMTLEGLADELDVSHQALSERLRRGHRNLIASTLFDAPEPVERTH